MHNLWKVLSQVFSLHIGIVTNFNYILYYQDAIFLALTFWSDWLSVSRSCVLNVYILLADLS